MGQDKAPLAGLGRPAQSGRDVRKIVTVCTESMHEDVGEIYDRQKNIDYPSEFIEGEKDCLKYMRNNIFEDWQAENVTSVLHEKRGGYAHNARALYRLADKAENEGVRIITGVEVKGFLTNGCVAGLETPKGHIQCDHVIIGAGPWAKTFWDMLSLPDRIDVNRHFDFLEMASGLDADPFIDLTFGYVTAATPAAALAFVARMEKVRKRKRLPKTLIEFGPTSGKVDFGGPAAHAVAKGWKPSPCVS